MACSNQTLAGLSGACDTSRGGIVEAYIINYDDVTAIAYDDTANTKITGVTLASGKTWYKYSFKPNTGSLTSTLNVDNAAGVNYVSSELVLQFSRMDTQKRIEMKALALNDLRVIVKDANGKFWFLGAEEPVSASGGSANSGQQRGDGNYFSITLTSYDSSFVPEFSGEITE